MITEGDEIPESSGVDDNQMPALCVVPGLFAFDYSAEMISNATQVISTNNDVVAGASAIYQCMQHLIAVRSLPEALSVSANNMTGEVGQLMREALTIEVYQPVGTAKSIGLACYVKHSLPVVWYLLNHAADFESVVRDNIRSVVVRWL